MDEATIDQGATIDQSQGGQAGADAGGVYRDKGDPDQGDRASRTRGAPDGGTGPRGELELRTVAMPADTNPAGDIFGGWIMSLMDLAAGTAASAVAKGRVATAAVSRLEFLAPVKVGDVVCCYAAVDRIGRSSITLGLEAWVLRRGRDDRFRVTAAEFVLVAVDAAGRPRPVAPE